MDSKTQYTALAAMVPLPLFYQPEWLDAVCGKDAWEVALALSDRQESVWVAWPYRCIHKFGHSFLLPPALTPYLGPWVHPHARDASSLIADVADQMPKLPFAIASSYPGHQQEFLPLYWKQWRHIGRITYTVNKGTSAEKAWAELDSAVRNKVRKAQKQYILEQSQDFEALWKTQEATFGAQKMQVPYTHAWLKQLFELIHKNKWGQLTLARDLEGRVAGAQLSVWDQQQGYNLLLSSLPQYRQDGVVQWLLWNSLEHTLSSGKGYDFEGSVMPAIAPVFSAFGAKAVPYYLLYKPGNKIWAALWELMGKAVK